MRKRTFIEMVKLSDIIDSEGWKVVCMIANGERLVCGYNMPISDKTKLRAHAELNAIFMWAKHYTYVPAHYEVYINRPPCSMCLRHLKHFFVNIDLHVFTDEDCTTFKALAEELNIPYNIYPGVE